MRRLSRSWLIIGSAALAALLLTITRPSPEGLIDIGVGNRPVRAAPGVAVADMLQKHNLAALDIVNKTLIKVQESYVDPSRIDPKEMLFAALDSVQFNIPEVLVDPDRANDSITVHVNDKRQTFSTSDIDSPWRLSKNLKRIFRFVEANMNPRADLAAVEYAAANGILETLDPHSVLLDPEAAADMRTSTGGGFAGLGIVIGMREKKLTVIRPMPNTPAIKAGIIARDHIVRINAELTENLTLTESVKRMKGKKGTKVTVFVKRRGQEQELQFDLVRAHIRVASVQSKLLSKNVGYIKLKQFSSPTTKETQKALHDLIDKGAKSFVLDLRSNPGGLLDQAIRVSDLFVDSGTIVTTVGGSEREAHRASRAKTLSRAPLAVLVNSNSASASEIVAGALKNLDRAIIIGDTSFGKGSVQILYDNDDTSTLKLTIAEYLTPGDLSIQGLGISPDVQLRRMFVPKKNTAPSDHLRLLPPSKRYRESDLKASLKSSYAKETDASRAELRFVFERSSTKPLEPDDPEGEFEDEESDDIVEDFEIRFARDLIASIGKETRSQTLKGVPTALTSPRAAAAKRLHEKLAALGIDWTPAPAAHESPQLGVSYELEGGNQAKAGDVVKVKGSVTNKGTTQAYRVQARIRSQDMGFEDREMLFGSIAPGETKTWTSHIRIRRSAPDRVSYLRFETNQATGDSIATKPIRLRVMAADRPVFAYSHQVIDEGNGDGLVQAGEKHKLRITVRNTGKGEAEDTVALLRNTSGDSVKLEKARFDLDSLGPGESKVVEFVFVVAPGTKRKEIAVELQVYDGGLGESVSEKLSYALSPASAGPAAAKGSVRISEDAAVFEGASDTSAFIAQARKGTVFRVTGRLIDWLRVDMGNGRPGFVKRGMTQKSGGAAKLGGVDARMQVTPPALSLKVPTFETKSATYSLAGTVKDDSKVEDVYIFVSNREAKIDNRKVYYRSNRNGASVAELDFQAQIPLWPGSNRVTIIARESDGVRSARTLYLHRLDSAATASR
ncbi:MAG: PDZ domain-containing protein [Myxococcales bacterium]|nr:PDZ domain-containing protein [Myxococcales bacterium]